MGIVVARLPSPSKRGRYQKRCFMDRGTFREQLLAVMERKNHWAWPAFTSGKVTKTLLHLHFEQEYATYVRDFPVMVGWAYVRCPVPEVRRSLAENLYEEETGGLVAGSPHPELFLEYPRGLGMDLRRFETSSCSRRHRSIAISLMRPSSIMAGRSLRRSLRFSSKARKTNVP